ncbi:MAG: lipoyl(octanoyl) transferase LipB [Ignavibacteria bacterium]|jgi:lipoyl(octanoyl) transferase
MNVEDWGLIDFNDAWRRQRELSDAILHQDHPDTLVFCQHPPVITLGRNTQQGSVLASTEFLGSMGVDVIEINRGGEATIHNPGQLVGYPIFNLQRTKPDLHWFLRTIEQCIIDALAELDLASGRVETLTGVWVEEQRKICAIGIHCSRWITSHGFALNVNNDLGLFSAIVPCGITERGVTSIAAEKNQPTSLETVQDVVLRQFLAKFSKNASSG